MRTMFAYRYYIKKSFVRFVRMFISFFIISLLFLYILGMRDIVATISVNQLEYHVNNIINTAVYDCIDEQKFTFNELIIVDKDSYGNINSISIDPYHANLMKSRIGTEINERVNSITTDDLEITLGMLLGYCALGSWGPKLPLTVSPNGNVNIDFKNQFVSCGINQVQNNLLVDVNVDISALMPFYEVNTKMHSSVIVAQTVIVGRVPNTYLNIGE